MPPEPAYPNINRQKNLLLYLNLASVAVTKPSFTLQENFWDISETEKEKISSDLQTVIKGIKEYQSFPWQRDLKRNVVWQDGEVKIYEIGPQIPKSGKTILLVPSLINGSEILDLLPQRSFAQWLAGQGHRVLCIDWGDMTMDPELNNFDQLLNIKFGKILNRYSSTDLIGVGYCMGGLLLAAADKLYPEAFSKLAFIATPWDFEQNDKSDFPEAVRAWWKNNSAEIITFENLPAENLQNVFASLDPGLIVRKFSSFAAMDKPSEEAKLFVAVEDWVNSGSDIPMSLVYEMARDWYLENKVVSGDWRIGEIDKPSFVVIPQRDKIVPPSSAEALLKHIPHAIALETDCGHISMMVGRHAERNIWQPFHNWIVTAMA